MPINQRLHHESAQHGWDEHNLSQLRYFRSLSLREKLQAVEGMADVVRHFQQIRAQGGFKTASRNAGAPEMAVAASAVREPAAEYAAGSGRRVLALPGCTPEPLGNYLKALGVFRLVAEQADPQARAWWEDGVLWLQSKWSPKEITEFFLSGIGESKSPIYSPTPIFAPWGGRPGFYRDGNKEAKARLARILAHGRKADRFSDAAKTIRTIRCELRQRKWLNTKPRKEKLGVLTSARNSWPVSATAWFDACLAIEEAPRFGFLYGTGGNEGSADITNNFWELIEEVIGPPKPQPQSEEMLRSAIFGTARTAGTSRSAGQHFPSATDSPNVGQEFTGSTSANPWDVVLMMEGCILFAGAATKRLSQHGKGKAAFPFMLDYLATGEPQSSFKDEAKQDAKIVKCRAEFWMPLWRHATTLVELKGLLSEGRLQRHDGDPAKHSIQAMEAIASLGISRGIDAYQRVALFERRGKGYYVAASLGSVPIPRKPNATLTLLDELAGLRDQAYQNLREGPSVPDRILTARRQLNTAVAEFLMQHNLSKRIEPDNTTRVLQSVANIEREVSLMKDRARRLSPCSPLSTKWHQSASGDPEHQLARAIAGIASWGETSRGDSAPAVEAVRGNFLPITRHGNVWRWGDTSRSAVWARGASLTDNLSAVLRRRFIESTRGKGEGLPLWSAYGAGFEDLLAFWQEEIDEQRLADLIHALALVDAGTWTPDSIDRRQRKQDPTPDLHSSAVWFDADDKPRIKFDASTGRGQPLLPPDELRSAFEFPRVYALLKLCFVGGRLPARPVEGETVARSGAEPYPPSAPEILNLLQAGRLPEAVEIAVRKLRAKGYPAIFDPRLSDAPEMKMSTADCQRLTGLLLIPVRHPGVLAALAIKPQIGKH